VFAAQFYDGTAQDFNLQNAAEALTKSIGPAARILWGLGLLASGQSSTMTGTYAGQFVMEGFLEWKVSKFQRTLITRCIALVPAVAVAYYTQGQPGGLTSLEDDLNLLQSIQLPFAVLPIVRFTSSAAVMGQFANGRIISIFGSISTIVVLAVNGYAIYGFVEDLDFTPGTIAIVALATLFYVTLIGFVFFSKVGNLQSRKPSATDAGAGEGEADGHYAILPSDKAAAIAP
jgi:Mn2+/Fe2+ NRAMP family transporter